MVYLSTYIVLFKRLLLILGIYFLCRLGFFFFNLNLFTSIRWHEIIGAFLFGIVFDINAILYLNIPFLILSLIPFNFTFKNWYQLSIKIYFTVTNLLAIIFNIADFEYSKFIGKRSDSSLFGIKNDIAQQVGQMAMDYWYLSLIGILLGILLWKLYPTQVRKIYRLKHVFILITFALFMGILVLGLRASFGLKPLQPIAAYSKSSKTALLILNTPFCILHTIDKKPLEDLNYFSDEELVKNLPKQYEKRDTSIRTGQNILIFILESFSPEFVGHLSHTKSYTPFLDSIAEKGISFRHAFANGVTSQHAISSILTGTPNLISEPIITSVYQTNDFFSLAGFLKQYEYNAYFFHGGNNGTMGFDKFTSKIDFDYFGVDEYPDKNDHDGKWGIYDGPFLQYCADMLSKLPKPFIASIFTLSSHQPYLIPKELRDTFSQGKSAAQNAIAYTDYALKGFFEKASQKDWFSNTLFIFTADHTHPPIEIKWQSVIDYYRIPILFYHPEINLACDTAQIVQQVDILPSIIDFLGTYPSKFPKFGTSVFMGSPLRAAYSYGGNRYIMIRNGYYCEMKNKKINFYNWYQGLPETDSISADSTRLKAYIQYFNHCMIHNTF